MSELSDRVRHHEARLAALEGPSFYPPAARREDQEIERRVARSGTRWVNLPFTDQFGSAASAQAAAIAAAEAYADAQGAITLAAAEAYTDTEVAAVAGMVPVYIGTATLSGGTVDVSLNPLSSTAIILLTPQTAGGGSVGAVFVSARVVNTKFTILSSDGADDRMIGYAVWEP